MQKETVAKISIFLFLFITIISCAKKKNDILLLELVLKEANYKKEDSFRLIKNSDKSKIANFFKLRNQKTRTLLGNNEDPKNIRKKTSYSDSIAHIRLYEIIDTIKVTVNNYIQEGKGVSEISESFLKDTFNYKTDLKISWGLKENKYNIFPEDLFVSDKKVIISKPVYNSKKNKAIVYKEEYHSPRLIYKTIYLIEATKGSDWKIIFKQTDDIFWLD